jgi:tetratricopeptide (TPR) repeat protein
MQLDDHESLVWHNLAMWYGQTGRVEEAFTAIRRARELEPTRPIYTANYSLLLYETRRYDEAVAMARQVIERNARFDQARSVGRHHRSPRRRLPRAPFSASQRRQRKAIDICGPNPCSVEHVPVFERLDERASRGFAEAYEQAQIYATLGDIDQACAALARAVTDHSLLVNWMRLEPRLDPLRGSQCYADAERKLYATQ